MLKKQKKYLYLFVLIAIISCSVDKSSDIEEINSTAITNQKVEKKPYFIGTNPTPNGKKWKTVYKLTDEFSDNKINSKKWYTDPNAHPHLKWPGRLPALFQSKRIKANKGKMTIEVGKLGEPKTISPYGKPLTYTYYGGILRSKITSTVGNYYECRMKMSKTEMGGGFWLMGYNNNCNKKHEIDITESVGVLTPLTAEWARKAKWDKIYHSNAIRRENKCQKDSKRAQGAVTTTTKNHERYYVYGFWWKSATELVFFLDGKEQYTLTPPVPFNQQMYLQFSIESYDWNPIPADGGKVASANLKDRTCYVDYIRTFKLINK
ncbi:MAG: glycosyl hydrolase [Cellulophaga sp.]|uniref:glycosyl hydrolase n=1 Tax=Cellulophaga sp. TaxID=1972202 RepID=UPI000CB9EC1F|nr:hypothetical protein AX016_0109 [Cellulophaga sp. RHA19]